MGRSTGRGRPGALGLLAGAVALQCVLAQPVHAYIDPGTGSMVLQVVGALVAGAIFYFRESLSRIRGLFKREAKTTEVVDSRASDDESAS